MTVPFWAWMVLVAVVAVGLTVDLLAHRRAHVIGFREAAWWSVGWIAASLTFATVLGRTLGSGAGIDFTTAWLLEKSLSVDNLFVFALIFGYFKVPRAYQHRVLFAGVIGALVFRGIFLAAGVAVVERFTAVLFVFAAILLFSAYRLIRGGDDDYDPGRSRAVRLLRRIIPISDELSGNHFLTRQQSLSRRPGSVKEQGRWIATPLLAVVVTIEAADLVFAVDSVPAVLAVSDNAFIVYSSNAFAILGLRSLYFLLAGLLERFHLLSKGLAIILAFIGVKLALEAGHAVISSSIPEISSIASLAVIVAVLAGAIVLSLRRPLPPGVPAEPPALTDEPPVSALTH